MEDKVVINGIEYSDENRNYPNPYYMTDHGLYSVAREQYLDYLQREGTVVEDYWTSEKYHCFFRRNKDTNQTNDNISIYYPVGNGIQPGSLITYYGKTYLILNQESLENKVYHRSDGLNADVMLSTYNKATHEDINLPCFAYDLTSITPETSDIMSAINGHVELMTGDNEMSRKLGINCEFYAMGNWYSVGSINFKTGIARIGASIILAPSDPVIFDLKIEAEGTYTLGDSVKLNAVATADDTPLPNATLIWTSSNPDIVTVTEDGNALFTGLGSCAISCYWKEHDITDTVHIEVVEASTELKCEITGRDSIYTGSSATYTAKFYQKDGVNEDTTITPVWSLDVSSAIKNSVSITSQSGKDVTVTVSNGGYGLVGNSFGLNLTDASEQYHDTKTINISSWI